VIDTATNTTLTNLTVGDYPREIALSPDGSRGYVTNRCGDSVTVVAIHVYPGQAVNA
jgi:DNA-binding beta-propeller fold protein YncE